MNAIPQINLLCPEFKANPFPFSNNNWRVYPVYARFNLYLRQIFKIRRAAPKDDLISQLIQAEDACDKLSEDEMTTMND